MKIKLLILNHIEKLILLGFLAWGIVHIIRAFKPTETSNKAVQIDNLVKQVEQKHRTSQPPVGTVQDYYGRMAAPFLRVPRLDIDGTWKFYWVPNVSVIVKVQEKKERKVLFTLIQEIKEIEVVQGDKEVFEVEPIPGARAVLVKAYKKGTGLVVLHAPNGTKESISIVVTEEVIDVKPELYVREPKGLAVNPERGRVRLAITVNPINRDKTKVPPFLGHRLYRKDVEGEWEEIKFLKAAAEKKVEEKSGGTAKGPGASTKAAGGLRMPGAGATAAEGEKKETQQKATKSTVTYYDSTVKPDTSYLYAVTAVSKKQVDGALEPDEEDESDKVLSAQVLTKSNIEIFLEGIAGRSATTTVKKWINDSQSVNGRFFPRIGDEIGEQKSVLVDKSRRLEDFGTESLMVDIQPEVREAKIVEIEVNLRGENGQLIMDPQTSQLVKVKVKVQKLVRMPHAIVIDAKGRVRTYVRAEAP